MSTCDPNPERFNMEPAYDKSKFLTINKKQITRDFNSYGKRDTYELIK